jgi:hypothetical protein
VWSILTDTDDAGNAAALGLNFSAKLTFAALCGAARHAVVLLDGSLMFTARPHHAVAFGRPSSPPPESSSPVIRA